MHNTDERLISTYLIAAYTYALRITASLAVPGRRRLLDVLNFSGGPFIEVTEPTISFLDPARSHQAIRRDSLILNRRDLYFVVPIEEAREGSPDMRIQKTPRQAVIYTQAYLIRGDFHVIELLNLPDYLSQDDETYVALIEASAISIAHPKSEAIECDVLLINKRKITAIHRP